MTLVLMVMMKGLLYKWLFHAVFGHKRFQPIFIKMQYFGSLGQNIGLGWGISSSGELQLLKELASKIWATRTTEAPVIIADVGANRGDYSHEVNAIFHATNIPYRIYAFEPSPSAFKILSQRFKQDEPVTLFNNALGDELGGRTLYIEGPADTTASFLQPSAGGKYISEFEEVRVDTQDHFFEQSGLSHIDYLKIDTEGFDLRVLR